MTALETLLYNLLDLATLGTEIYSISTCLDTVDDDIKKTSITCSVTTALNNIQVQETIVIVRNAQSYVESMTTEELLTLEQMLAEKELSFNTEDIEKEEKNDAKVYIKKDLKQQ